MPKLNQILAVEKGVKGRNETEFTKIHQAVQKPDLLTGLTRTYAPAQEGGETFPAEQKKVQIRAEEQIKRLAQALGELFDVAATKDTANCGALADVEVDGKSLLKAVPVTHLLFIEKKLVDLHTFAKKLPVLDQADDWQADAASGLWKTEPTKAAKTRKVTEFPVVVPATPEHPAQVKETTKDVVVGEWTTVKYSGAVPLARAEQIVERVEKLQRAVKFAREQANLTEAPPVRTGEAVLGYIFG